jgi:hypothetical protein
MNIRKLVAFFSMTLGTALSGLALGALTAFVLSRLIGDDFAGWGGLVAVGIGMAIGYPAGVVVGQVVARFVLHYPGSLLWGMIGVMVGVSPLVIGEIWPVLLPAGSAVLILVLCPLLGTIGYFLGKQR